MALEISTNVLFVGLALLKRRVDDVLPSFDFTYYSHFYANFLTLHLFLSFKR